MFCAEVCKSKLPIAKCPCVSRGVVKDLLPSLRDAKALSPTRPPSPFCLNELSPQSSPIVLSHISESIHSFLVTHGRWRTPPPFQEGRLLRCMTASLSPLCRPSSAPGRPRSAAAECSGTQRSLYSEPLFKASADSRPRVRWEDLVERKEDGEGKKLWKRCSSVSGVWGFLASCKKIECRSSQWLRCIRAAPHRPIATLQAA